MIEREGVRLDDDLAFDEPLASLEAIRSLDSVDAVDRELRLQRHLLRSENSRSKRRARARVNALLDRRNELGAG
jgi:hypothetical protein